MNFVSNERILANLPIPYMKTYDKWYKQMKVLFGYQDVLKVLKNMDNVLVEGAKEAQLEIHKEKKNKDFKAIFFYPSVCGR